MIEKRLRARSRATPGVLMMRRVARSRGFTLVEVAVVVVLVGVLAVIGVVVFSRYRAAARMSEATTMTAGIRAAQEAFKTENGVYAAVSNDVNSFYPSPAPGKFVTAWGAKCVNCVGGDINGWKRLNVAPHGPVMYGYATVGSVGSALAGSGVPTGAAGDITAPAALDGIASLGATTPVYVTVAWGDSNADGKPAMVVSYSVSNQIFVQQE